MADELGPAVAALQRKLEEQLQDVASTKRTINMLMKMSGKEALFPEDSAERSGAVRPDQFYGKGLATSAAEYLAMRHQACQPDEIYNALVAGGFDFDLMSWQKDDQLRIRSLAMSLAKNTGSAGKFHRLKNGSFGLRAWYDPDFLNKEKKSDKPAKKKAASKKAKASKAPPVTAVASITDKTAKKSSAKEKSRPAADQTVPKEAVS
jgi:hypothetical protein